jgi:hypothetical protein
MIRFQRKVILQCTQLMMVVSFITIKKETGPVIIRQGQHIYSKLRFVQQNPDSLMCFVESETLTTFLHVRYENTSCSQQLNSLFV